VAAWATSPSDSAGGAFVDQSVRLIVNPTTGGRRVRVRLSNRFSSEPVTFGSAFVARREAGAKLVPGSARRLRFRRRQWVTIPAGGEVVSDAIRFRFEPFEDLAVSLYVTGASGRPTEHFFALETSFVSPTGSGDQTADEAGGRFTQTLATWPYLTDVEVSAPRRVRGVVTLGDSITEGFPGPIGANARYSDFLARRLAVLGDRTPFAVQNAGVSGNRVLRDASLPIFGPKLLDRLDLDSIDQAGAGVVIVMAGTNDIGTEPPATASEVIAGLQVVVARLHAAGLAVLLGTQTPSKGYPFGLHGTAAAIAARNQINDWIRTSGVGDGVVDFHAALRDPSDPDRLRPDFDSGDHLHPNASGYAAMAGAVDPSLLDDPACDR
jgi:lysophospholipase L1-like esterase